jgi:hypothetical protein
LDIDPFERMTVKGYGIKYCIAGNSRGVIFSQILRISWPAFANILIHKILALDIQRYVGLR